MVDEATSRPRTSPIAATPDPPYVAVIFTSRRTTDGSEEYAEAAARMVELAHAQPGFLGIESVSSGSVGITTSYWATEEDARGWKTVAEHRAAQARGRTEWYAEYSVRVATVTRAYTHG